MTLNRDKAHEVTDDGLVIGDSAHLVSGSSVPTLAMPSPSGPTVYFQDNGSVWTWTGTVWQLTSAGKNFSYRKILAGTVVGIVDEQQMIVSQEIEIQDTGELEVFGEMVVIV